MGDLFQQYAAKYVGISRGIPLSNTNQLWGLLWGVFVFGELTGAGSGVYWRVIGGPPPQGGGGGGIGLAPAPRHEPPPPEGAGGRRSARPQLGPALPGAR